MSGKRTWTIRRRSDGEVGTVLDVTGMSEWERTKLFNGLVYKVNFEDWELVDSDDAEPTA